MITYKYTFKVMDILSMALHQQLIYEYINLYTTARKFILTIFFMSYVIKNLISNILCSLFLILTKVNCHRTL